MATTPRKSTERRNGRTTRRTPEATGTRRRLYALASVGGVIVVAVLAFAALSSASGGDSGKVVQGRGGQWTNVNANQLASMLTAKDFTLLNVKTPYIGEIKGTDLYIPYTELQARSAQLPQDRNAKIVVYCRTGSESAVAAQTLLDLGYTNIWNLDGGMTAWAATGRQIIQVSRS